MYIEILICFKIRWIIINLFDIVW